MRLSELVRLALDEDVGGGDITTNACVAASSRGAAHIVAKSQLVVCGHDAAAEVFRQLGADYQVLRADGGEVSPGTTIARLEGAHRALLTGERLALNFLMSLSGIATHTRAVLRHAPPELRVVDTRKTTPLHRALERRAVVVGGAGNHRFALYDGVLIKDNHIIAAGGIQAAIEAAREHAHHLLKIEVEVEDASQADEAVAAGADVVMLDNMSDDEMAPVIARHRGPVLFEASGNITADRLPALAAIGVHVVSIGGLIHQARWADLSMRFEG